MNGTCQRCQRVSSDLAWAYFYPADSPVTSQLVPYLACWTCRAWSVPVEQAVRL